ncbi:MAG: hypothetical protein RL662_2117 [Bacteroidota bacterium]
MADDEDVIKIDLLENAGERYFFKMLMKVDTNIAFGEDIVLWDGRGVPAPPAPAAAPLAAPAGFAAPASASFAAPVSEGIDFEAAGLQPVEGFDGLYANPTMMAAIKQQLADQEAKSEEEKKVSTDAAKVEDVKVDNTKLTKAAIKRISRNGLEALIAENKLEIEIKEGMTNAQLSDKIIEVLGEAYFSEELAGDKAE